MLTLLLVALAALNLAPSTAFFRPGAFERLYGVRADSAELRVVLRHRAALLGCVGALLTAVWEPRWVGLALGLAAASKVTFLLVCALERPSRPLLRVAAADAGALVGLAAAALLSRT
jgi:hypothetical protein